MPTSYAKKITPTHFLRLLVWVAMTSGGFKITCGQELAFRSGTFDDRTAENPALRATAQASFRAWAEEIASKYQGNVKESDPTTLLLLQLAANDSNAVASSLKGVTERNGAELSGASTRIRRACELYATATLRSESERVPLVEALSKEARNALERSNDILASQYIQSLEVSLDDIKNNFDRALSRVQNRTSLPLSSIAGLIAEYETIEIYKSFQPVVSEVVAEDDGRRYIIQKHLSVPMRDGATLEALVVKKREITTRLPALLQFTIYPGDESSLDQGRASAAHGYVGVVAYVRGKGASSQAPIPFEHDPDDAYDLVQWLSSQSWSDGRIGMYGGSYSAFTGWAAMKRMPPALKGVMVEAATAPGIDTPMEGNIFWNFYYKQPLYTATTHYLNETLYGDYRRWNRLFQTWYLTGQPYRSLPLIDGFPNPIFLRWLNHPAYDAYWQAMVPYQHDFSGINIPVLTTTGYFDGAQLSALYLFEQHYMFNKAANHYLVIGPFDHQGSQHGPDEMIDGYRLDPSARINIDNLRYEWFDYLFLERSRPDILKDKVNYEVMGENQWRHVPSIAAMSNGSMRFYLANGQEGAAAILARQKTSDDVIASQQIDFADRSDVDQRGNNSGVSDDLDTHNSLEFISDEIRRPIEWSGPFSAELDCRLNKKDFDFTLTLYALLPNHKYLQLCYSMARASYVGHQEQRQLLEPGKRTEIKFKSGRLTSYRLEAGSRIVALLSVNKSPALQLNSGSGKDVSDETIVDAGPPLSIQWYGSSFIELPVWNSND